MRRRLFVRLDRRFGGSGAALSRRDVLKGAVAISAGAVAGCSPFLKAVPRKATGRSVLIVGAGFAGLACADGLGAAGYDVTVVEARNRLGGRVLSFNDTHGPGFIPNRNVEGGGELIGSNHLNWVSYARRFGLEFIDAFDDADDDEPIVIGERLLSVGEARRLWEEMDAANDKMNVHAVGVDADRPWESAGARELDNRSLQQWIDGLEVSQLCKTATAAELAANNGVPCSRASYLGMLAVVKGGGLDKYWTDSEVYRCKGGNQQLALSLADAVGRNRITLGVAVTEIAVDSEGVTARCSNGSVMAADHVVVAVPPSAWRHIAISPPLPKELVPQMGTAVKYLARVKSRFWKSLHRSASAFGDGSVSNTWDATAGQPGEGDVGFTCFSGADAADACRKLAKNERDATYRTWIEKWYPKFGANFVSSRFMDWPSVKWTGAGYSFPAPGQVTTLGPILRNGLGRLHFAGEHTSYAFVGYMEGALSSGVSLARRIAQGDEDLDVAGRAAAL